MDTIIYTNKHIGISLINSSFCELQSNIITENNNIGILLNNSDNNNRFCEKRSYIL